MLKKLWLLQKAIYQELKNTRDLTDLVQDIYNISPETENFPYLIFSFEEINFISTKTDKNLSLKLIFKICSNQTTNQELIKIGYLLEKILPSIDFAKHNLNITLIAIQNVKFIGEKDKQLLTLSYNLII